MNDELNHEVTSKTVALTFRAARLTKDVLAKAFKAYLDNRQQKGPAEPKHGKMKLGHTFDLDLIEYIPQIKENSQAISTCRCE